MANMMPALWGKQWIVGQTPEGYDVFKLPDGGGTFVAGPNNVVEYAQYAKYGMDPLPKDAVGGGGGAYMSLPEKNALEMAAYEQLAPGASIFDTAEGGMKYRTGGDSDKMRAAGWQIGPSGDWERNGVTFGNAFKDMMNQRTAAPVWGQQPAQQPMQQPAPMPQPMQAPPQQSVSMYGQQSAPAVAQVPFGDGFSSGGGVNPYQSLNFPLAQYQAKLNNAPQTGGLLGSQGPGMNSFFQRYWGKA